MLVFPVANAQPLPIPEPTRPDAKLESPVAFTVEPEMHTSPISQFPEAQSPVPIPDPRWAFVADAMALTVELEIIKKFRTEVPWSVPPAPIAAPLHFVEAKTTLFVIVKFSTADDPEATIPPPTPAPLDAAAPLPLEEAVTTTSPPLIINLPRNVAFGDAAGPAPIPVPPLASIDPFTNSSEPHFPFAAVPIPDPLVPAATVSDPPGAAANVTFENSAHSTPVE
jgi:hypothetical protein